MKVPISWLKELLSFDSIDLDAAHIADKLTSAGLEVEGVDQLPLSFKKVVVGKVLGVEPHPEADKLQIATVTDGSETFQVVCGGPNCREGLVTAFAKVGATLSTSAEDKPLKIKKSKIRGVESFGMLCAGQELGISDDDAGIIEFPEDAHIGTDLEELYGDTIFNIALTPNLGYCNSVFGVARELAAVTDTPFEIPTCPAPEEDGSQIQQLTSVEVQDSTNCPRYACRVIRDVTVGPSPQWLKHRLEGCGLRSINNIVDITNLVLMECGQPLHAFDYDKLAGNRIVVRLAHPGEHFTTLDGVEHALDPDMLLICDAEKPVALGGVMGGQNSEISDETVNVLLESAYFHPTNIRRTSKKLALHTDSSHRFERGCDPNGVPVALDRAAALLAELTGGHVAEGILDIKSQDFPEAKVSCRFSRINQILGTQLSVSEVESIFDRLHLPYEWDREDTFTITVPTYRCDLTAEIDLIEEVARIYGYDNITTTDKAQFSCSTTPHAPIFVFEKDARRCLIAEGMQEFLTCDLIGPSLMNTLDTAAFPDESLIKVLNPTSVDQSILRPSLLPGVLQAVKHNIDRQIHNISAFEVGRVHFKKQSQSQDQDQYKEQSMASVIITGSAHPTRWDGKTHELDFYDLKGIIENLLRGLDIEKPGFVRSSSPNFHPGRQASVIVKDLDLGVIGELHPSTLRRMGIPQKVFFAEINLHDLYTVRKAVERMTPLPLYPGSERDWTLTVREDIPVDTFFKAAEAISSRFLKKMSLVSVYHSEQLGLDKKNITFNFFYRNDKKTISQEVVDAEHERVVNNILEQINIQ